MTFFEIGVCERERDREHGKEEGVGEENVICVSFAGLKGKQSEI